MLVFAYDGSLNDDWVAHYAARFAADAPLATGRLIAGNSIERVLRDAPADVAVYRSGS